MPVSVFVRVPVPVLAPADIAKHEVQRPRRSAALQGVMETRPLADNIGRWITGGRCSVSAAEYAKDDVQRHDISVAPRGAGAGISASLTSRVGLQRTAFTLAFLLLRGTSESKKQREMET